MEEQFAAAWKVLNDNNVDFGYLRDAVNDIHHSYTPKKLKSKKATLIDYDQVIYQYAYIYLYLTSHTNVVADLLGNYFWNHRLVRRRFQNCQNSLRICSIGGGPGSDVFGVNLFLERFIGRVNIHGNVLDCCKSWKDPFDDLLNELDARNLNNVCYRYFDFFTKTDDFNTVDAIASADLVTIVKFISAVCSNRDYAENKLKEMLKQVKQGAMVLFVDNNGGGYLELMSQAATSARLKNIEELTDIDFEVPMDEQLEMTRMTENLSLTLPQQSSRISASIWYK